MLQELLTTSIVTITRTGDRSQLVPSEAVRQEELEYSNLLDAVRELVGGDDNTKCLKALAEQNHGAQRCSSRRRAMLKQYVREAAAAGLQLNDENDIIAGVLKTAPDAR